MKELNDKDFDQLFRARIAEELPEFEEESWLKMEKKLRKKDRMIFYRNASIILLFLSFGLGFYLTNRNPVSEQPLAGKKTEQVKPQNEIKSVDPSLTNGQSLAQNEIVKSSVQPVKQSPTVANKVEKKETFSNRSENFVAVNQSLTTTIQTNPLITPKTADQLAVQDVKPLSYDVKNPPVTEVVKPVEDLTASTTATAPVIAQTTVPTIENIVKEDNQPKTPKVKHKLPISLAISAGPDFNSTTALVGGKTSFAFGFSVGVGISKRLALQTGMGLGFKNYNANGNAYTLKNPIYQTTSSLGYGPVTTTQATIDQINAACRVLEVPLLASFLVSENQKRSLFFNAGLSSYFMLKENYVFKFAPAAGKNDWTMEKVNANQHILSVVNLSATYNLKLKNKKMGFGIEPYVKIPLTGIGEGSVPLKSSGVSLKLQYDFNKK